MKIIRKATIHLLGLLGLMASSTSTAQPMSRYLAVPDYVGQRITILTLNRNRLSYNFTIPNCNPNSVAQSGDRLYVACNKDYGHGDHIDVFDLVTLAGLRPRNSEVQSDQSISSTEFNGIIAAKFDPSGNLWVSSYYNDKILRFSKASLGSAKPAPDRILVHSPDAPTGLTFDPRDGSLWVVGQYQGGVLLNIPPGELNRLGYVDANHSYCLSNNAPGCKAKPGLFDHPEGIAMINNEIWISNNGGNHPGASLVRLRPGIGDSTRIGNGLANPFSCPGGLEAGTEGLWINDQSFGLKATTCGESDPAQKTGKVLVYSTFELNNPAGLPLASAGLKNASGRPGFGGITVFSSWLSFSIR